MTTNRISRRDMLRSSAGGTFLLALGGSSALTACGGDDQESGEAVPSGEAQLPDYLPFQGVEPDLPGELGGTAGYLTYPSPPVDAIDGKPLAGGTYTAMVKLLGELPALDSSNQYWTELQSRLGADLDLQLIPGADYESKFATTVASGDLPDLLEIPTGPLPPQLPGLLEANSEDLTPFLAGDAVKDYPFLANIETLPWKTCVFNGKIYGVPVPRTVIGSAMFRRDDLIEERGLNPDPANFAEFEELCQGLTDPKNNRWALSRAPGGFIRKMLRVPNIWTEEGGKLTHGLEMPESKRAIELTAKMFADGLVHPDASGTSGGKQALFSGAAALHTDGFSAWFGLFQASEGAVGGAISPPGFDGGDPLVDVQAGSLNFTALKKASEDRIRELLSLLNWYSAPFGTSEYLFRMYGLEGVHHTMEDGSPVQTELGISDTGIGGKLSFHLADSPKVIHYAGFDDVTRAANSYAQKIAPFAIPDAAAGLYSETDGTKGPTIRDKLNQVGGDIVQGRKTLDDYDDAVQAWRSEGGDQIRAEYEEALQRNG